MSRKRHGLKRSKAAKLFAKTAQKIHKKNSLIRPMRGGIRL